MEITKKGLLEAINSRRSTRKYRPDPVSRELVGEIVEVGRMAPSSSNHQSSHFIVITDSAKMAELRQVFTTSLAGIPIREDMTPPLVGLIKKAQAEIVDVNYGAPVLILMANKKENDDATADCACALENMMLMAAACGIGCCWINQYKLLRESQLFRAFMQKLGMGEDEEVFSALALGYTDSLETTPLPRKGNPVTYC